MISSFVVTGYLGSGKTSLIVNSAREHLKDKRVAVIVNEFGDVGVDGKILNNVYAQVVELAEGCICCKLSQDFESAVRKLIQDYKPEVLIVETSGSAEPFPVVFSLKTLGLFVDGVICVVDAKNFNKYKDEETARYQLGSSNIVVLNKTDLVPPEELPRIEEEVKRIKERYKLVNLFSHEEKKNLYKVYRAVHGRVPPEVFAGSGTPLELVDLHHHHSHDNLCEEVVYFDKELSYEELEKYLRSLPEEVIRAKGIVKLKDFPHPVFVHYVFGDYDIGMPAQGYEGKPFLVLIKERR
ncbi:MAG: GTP-binding protein [Aquificae bacterium]|nr:GTP-binding protein [Aquificota bacterium]